MKIVKSRFIAAFYLSNNCSEGRFRLDRAKHTSFLGKNKFRLVKSLLSGFDNQVLLVLQTAVSNGWAQKPSVLVCHIQ
jgi:hypothetical protein